MNINGALWAAVFGFSALAGVACIAIYQSARKRGYIVAAWLLAILAVAALIGAGATS